MLKYPQDVVLDSNSLKNKILEFGLVLKMNIREKLLILHIEYGDNELQLQD